MKITICGSIAFYDEMVAVERELLALGHEVKLPSPIRQGQHGEDLPSKDFYAIRHTARPDETWVWDEKERGIMDHFEKVAWGDAILVLNYDKNNVVHYVGPNSLMEMGLALYLHKPIYLYYAIPAMSYTEEILGMKPIVLDGDLAKI